MEKIIFKNKGEEGAIPINADNLNLMQTNVENSFKSGQTTSDTDTYNCNYINQITSKSAIIVSLTSNTTINVTESWGFNLIPFDKIQSNFGDAFTLNDNGTITYNKTSGLVRVILHVTAGTIPARFFPIIRTGSKNSQYQGSIVSDGFMDVQFIYSVTQGQTIDGYVRPNMTGNSVLKGDDMYTYMIVEEI